MSNVLEKLYFSPIFSEAKCEQSGGLGIVYSGVNLAVWAAVVGGVAHVAGSKKALFWAGGTFGALILAEILFNASGPTTNAHTIALNAATDVPHTASTLHESQTPATTVQAPAQVHSTGYTELENEDFGVTRNGFTNE